MAAYRAGAASRFLRLKRVFVSRSELPSRQARVRLLTRLCFENNDRRRAPGSHGHQGRSTMTTKLLGAAGGAILVAVMTVPAAAQTEQFIPHLVYRTGAYAPNGVPF